VLPGTPLDRGVSDEQVTEALGEKISATIRQQP
jgi:hypothetical protein